MIFVDYEQSLNYLTLSAEGKEAITNTEALKAKGNFQLIKTIKNIEYQILIILMYFALAFAINW